MEISEFAFKLLLLFFPGIICTYLIDQLTIHKPRESFFFLLQSFVWGITTYFIYWAGLKCIDYFWPNHVNPNIIFLRALSDTALPFSFKEIAAVSIISIILACMVSIASRYKLLNRTAGLFRISDKFGELDVWGYMLNMEEVNWVTVRDYKYDLIYDGWVEAFSDDSKNAELLLRDVSLYKNSTGERLYQIGIVYLSRNREDISIESRTSPIDERVKWKEEKNNG